MPRTLAEPHLLAAAAARLADIHAEWLEIVPRPTRRDFATPAEGMRRAVLQCAGPALAARKNS
jgi:hypothetical protein